MTDSPRCWRVACLFVVTGAILLLSGVAGAATFDSETDGFGSLASDTEHTQNESWTTPGTYSYDVSDRSVVELTLVGAGGGGGAYDGTDDGSATDGGAGGAIDAVVDVSEFSELQIYVGEGGGGGENATAGAGGAGRASGGDGGLDANDEFGFHAAGGGGGGSTEVRGDGAVTILAADGGGGGSAWDEHGNICCDDASGGGGGAGGSAGVSSGDRGITSIGSQNGTAGESLDDRPGFGGDGGDASSDTETTTAGGDGGVWANTAYLIDTATETDGGGAAGGTGGAETGTSGGDGSAFMQSLDPQFEIQTVTASDELKPGEEVVVTAEITNTGGFAGTQTVHLDAEQLGTDSDELSLAEGETTELTLSVETQPDDEGSYTLTVETDTDVATTSITLAGEAVGFELLNIAPEEPTVTQGDSVELAVDIQNVGSESTTQNVSLTVDGDVITTESVTLSGEEEGQSVFILETAEYAPGEYDYTVATEGAELTGSVLIEESEPGDATDATDGEGDDGTADDASENGDDSDGLPGAILGIGALLLLLLVGVLGFRRRGDETDGSSDTGNAEATKPTPETTPDSQTGATADSSKSGETEEQTDNSTAEQDESAESSAEQGESAESSAEQGESAESSAEQGESAESSAEQDESAESQQEDSRSEDSDNPKDGDSGFDESGFEWGPPGGGSS